MNAFGGAAPPRPLLAVGARAILGGGDEDALAAPIRPRPDTLFGPRGVCFAGPALLVCDTGHHRVLGWARIPEADGTPADFVLGQKDLFTEGQGFLAMPTGIAWGNGVLAVADAWHHRILLWHGLPARSGAPPDLVLGQADLEGTEANRGRDAPAAGTLNWPYGVAIADGRLLVADTGNRRMLVWDRLPDHNGTSADLVLGQPDFTSRDLGGGAAGMRWPHGIAAAGPTLLVADAGASRIMVWRSKPSRDGAPCDLVLGQRSRDLADHNGGAAEPDARRLNMPYGLAATDRQLLVADTANSRLLGFDLERLEGGVAASALAGQDSFAGQGENRWRPVARDSLCWPFGVTARGGLAAVADSGNNRVLLWDMRPAAAPSPRSGDA